MRIENVEVYGLANSIRASKFPMAVDTSKCTSDVTSTAITLGTSAPGTGHDNYLCGIVVQFDLTFSIKAWTEMERYNFADIVSSQSTMHRIARFDPGTQCNEYVTEEAVALVRRLIDDYEREPLPENYLRLLYNVPVGFELTARMTTNYRQLKTIYHQRKNHRLPEWREFCKWIETLPRFRELCLGTEEEQE